MRDIKKLLVLSLICVIFSCEKEYHGRIVTCTQGSDYAYLDNYKIDSLCTDNLCVNYQKVWKELLMEQNNLSHSYFENNIELCQSSINNWMQGASFRICYKVKLDWAIAYGCDQFIIKIEKDNTLYPSLYLPRDTYLSKDQIKRALSAHAFSSDIVKLSNIETLRYNSLKRAMEHMIRQAEVNTLCSNRIYINKSTGNLLLEAYGEYINESNSCIRGSIDLFTGETIITDTHCLIID